MTSVKFWMHTLGAFYLSQFIKFFLGSGSISQGFHMQVLGVYCLSILGVDFWRVRCFILYSVFILFLRIKDLIFSLPTVGERNGMLLKFSRYKFSIKKSHQILL